MTLVPRPERHSSLEYGDEKTNIETVRKAAEDFEGMMETRGLKASSTIWIENFNNVYQVFLNALNSILIKREAVAGMLISQEEKDELNGDIAAVSVLKDNLANLIKETKQYTQADSPQDIPEDLKSKFRNEFEGFRTIIPKYLEDREKSI